MKGNQMKKKKIIWYAALIVGISALSIMAPKLIHRASGMLLQRIGAGDSRQTEETGAGRACTASEAGNAGECIENE